MCDKNRERYCHTPVTKKTTKDETFIRAITWHYRIFGFDL